MNKIVDRDTFLHYLNTADVDWEATARKCIAKGFELAEENKKLNEKLYTLTKTHYDEQRARRMFEYKLEKIKEYVNQLEIFTHIKEDLLNIIEGAEDE